MKDILNRNRSSQLPDWYGSCAILNRDQKEVRSLTPLQLPFTAQEKKVVLFRSCSSDKHVFWMYSDLLLSTAPCLLRAFVRTNVTHKGQKTKRDGKLVSWQYK